MHCNNSINYITKNSFENLIYNEIKLLNILNFKIIYFRLRTESFPILFVKHVRHKRTQIIEWAG